MARPIERPKHHHTPLELTINVEDAFNYLDKFKNTPDYPKSFSYYTPNKYQLLGAILESKFGVSMVEARKIVGMWFDRNKNIKTENKINKVVKLDEKALEALVTKIIKEEKIQEALPKRERERHQTNWRKRDFEPYDREKDIMGAFGPYSSDVPPNVISYLRKNPRTFLKRVVDIYGMDKVLDFIGYQQPEMAEGYDSYMDDVHEEEKWIQKAIEKPGSLRRKMGVKKGEKLSPSDIKAKIKSLEDKDKDPNKPGVQGLGKSDLRTYRQLNLAKTLRGLK